MITSIETETKKNETNELFKQYIRLIVHCSEVINAML